MSIRTVSIKQQRILAIFFQSFSINHRNWHFCTVFCCGPNSLFGVIIFIKFSAQNLLFFLDFLGFGFHIEINNRRRCRHRLIGITQNIGIKIDICRSISSVGFAFKRQIIFPFSTPRHNSNFIQTIGAFFNNQKFFKNLNIFQ